MLSDKEIKQKITADGGFFMYSEARNDLLLVDIKIGKLLDIPEREWTRRHEEKLKVLSDIAQELRKLADEIEKKQKHKRRERKSERRGNRNRWNEIPT